MKFKRDKEDPNWILWETVSSAYRTYSKKSQKAAKMALNGFRKETESKSAGALLNERKGHAKFGMALR
jgi:hypothetical protein